MHNVTHGSFHRDVFVLQLDHFRSEMPASRLWKKLHEDMYFILSYVLLKVLIWMYACLITYVLSIREKKSHCGPLCFSHLERQTCGPSALFACNFFYFSFLLSCTHQPRKRSIGNRHKSKCFFFFCMHVILSQYC